MGWVRSEAAFSRIKYLRVSLSLLPPDILDFDLRQPEHDEMVKELWGCLVANSNLPDGARLVQMRFADPMNGPEMHLLVECDEWPIMTVGDSIEEFKGRVNQEIVDAILPLHEKYKIGNYRELNENRESAAE